MPIAMEESSNYECSESHQSGGFFAVTKERRALMYAKLDKLREDLKKAVAKIAAFSGWLSNPETGFIGLLILTVWQMSGYMMIVYIAQIQQIPESVKEAARIDGANSWQLMRYIILPLMMPAFTIGLFLSISSSFKMFDQNLALTQGGPYKSTEMIALNIYNSAFGANEFGFAQAKAIVFLIIVAGIGVTQLVITKRKEVEM